MNGEDRLQGEESVAIPVDGVVMEGSLAIPRAACGIVLFAHGCGSSRFSPWNRVVAEGLWRAGLATLSFDLLTWEEEIVDTATVRFRYDVRTLSRRLMAATIWVATHDSTRALDLGYLGSSTGAAAALIAASRLGVAVSAIVSRGGRPDLAGSALAQVLAPTLLIVGGGDSESVAVNHSAFSRLDCEKSLVVVPEATDLLEGTQAIERVTELAACWFQRRMYPPPG